MHRAPECLAVASRHVSRSRLLWLTAATALLVAACGSSSSTSNSGGTSAPQPYKIGVINTLSGPIAAYGTPLSSGIHAAAVAINAQGGIDGHKLDLITEDDTGDPSIAHSYVSTLAADGAIAIAGFILSADFSAAAPLATPKQIVMAAFPYAQLIGEPTSTGRFVYSTDADPVVAEQQQAFALGSKLVSGSKRVAIVWSTNSTEDAAIKNEDMALAKSNGWNVVSVVGYDPTQSSWAAQNTQLLSSKPNIILSSTSGSDMVSMVKALQTAKISVPILEYDSATSAAAFSALSYPDLYGASAWRLPNQTQFKGVQQYVAAAKAVDVDPSAAFVEPGYVEIEVVAQALRQCAQPCTSVKLQTAFDAIRNYTGDGLLVGPANYSASNHFGMSSVQFLHWVNGAMVAAP